MSLLDIGQMLTPAQLADRLHVHVNTIRRWTDEGILPCYRIGLRGDRRFTEAQITAFLKNAEASNLRAL